MCVLKMIIRLAACLMMILAMLASCAAGEEILLPDALLRIEDEAFMGNPLFEHVVLPDRLEAIGPKAFADCSALETVYIPSSVQEIADDAFAGCEGLTILCAWDSYAAQYAAQQGIAVEASDAMPVSVSVDRLMCEGTAIDLVWEVQPAGVLDGDLCGLIVMLDGAEYTRFEPSSDLRFALSETHETAVTGMMYAVCQYTRANGQTIQAISGKTQLVGGMSAALTALDTAAKAGENVAWELDIQQAAGVPVVQYTVYDAESVVYAQTERITDRMLSIRMDKAGTYTASASVVDGLGREVFAESGAVTVSGKVSAQEVLTYRLNPDGAGYTVIGCDLAAQAAIIPDTRNGLPVTAIADGAFVSCDQLIGVQIGANVRSIGAYAFHGCEALAQVVQIAAVEEIGEGAFSGCTSLAALDLPETLTSIPDRFAQGCTSLSSVALGGNVARIGGHAFENCTSLTDFEYPAALAVIGDSAFAGCTRLKAIGLPASLTSLGDRAFAACLRLKEAVLPEGVVSVGDSAFAGCTALETARFENKDTAIGQETFAYCSGVEIHTPGEGAVLAWAQAAGVDCMNTAIPTLEAGAAQEQYVGRTMTWKASVSCGAAPYTFSFEVYAGETLAAESGSLIEGVYSYTPEEEGLYHAVVTVVDAAGNAASIVTAPVEVLPASADALAQLKYELNAEGTGYIITGFRHVSGADSNVVIPDRIDGLPVTEIADSAFSGWSGLQSMVIPNSVTKIGRSVFSCRNMKRVVLSENLTEIGVGAFSNCISLAEVVIPDGVQMLSERMFEKCTSLKRIEIPESVTSCGTYPFTGCTALEEVIWHAHTETLPDSVLQSCTALQKVTITSPVTKIANYAFGGCTALKSVEGLDHVTYVGEHAFQSCKALKEMRLLADSDQIAIDTYAFNGCSSLERIHTLPDTRLVIDDNASTLGNYAFAGCSSLKEIEVHAYKLRDGNFKDCVSLEKIAVHGLNSTEAIGQYAFANCTSLRSIVVEPALQKADVSRYAFENCAELTEVPFVISNLGTGAFRGCSKLTSAAFSLSGDDISSAAFKDCTSLAQVEAGSFENIGVSAFENCVSLEAFDLAELSYTHNRKIYSRAFANCISLMNLVFTGKTDFSSIADDAFDGCSNLTVTTDTANEYVKGYFAAKPEFSEPIVADLAAQLSGEIEWGAPQEDGAVVEAKITVYNTRDGLDVSGEEFEQALSDATVRNAGLAVYSSCMSVRHKDDSETMYPADTTAKVYALGDIAYRGSAQSTVVLECRSEDPSACVHGDLRVIVSSDNYDDYQMTSAAPVRFAQRSDGDLSVGEDTTMTADQVISGDLYVDELLVLHGSGIRCTGRIVVGQGGTIRMNESASLRAPRIEILQGGAIEMNGFAHINADELESAGVLSLLSDACAVDADVVSVIENGVLSMDASGEIRTDRFIFDTGADHSAMLSDGVISARHAQLRRNFQAGKGHAFVLTGGACTLDVSRTSPKQHFSVMVIDCGIGNLSVEGFSALTGLPFEAEHFSFSWDSIAEETEKSNSLCREIYEKYIAAKSGGTQEEREALEKKMSGWYSVTLSSSGLTDEELASAQKAATYAEKALLSWTMEQASSAPDGWSDVNDILSSISASMLGGEYSYREGLKTYTAEVKPLGGLSSSAAAVNAGTIVCTAGGKSYTFVYALNPTGIRQGAGEILTIMRKYAQDAYIEQLNKAVEEVVGKEYAKYVLAVVKVVQTGIIEEKELYEVIAEEYGKSTAKALISQKFPIAEKTGSFLKKWDDYVSQTEGVVNMAEDTRNGRELPSDLMRDFLDLSKLAL